MHTHLAEVPAEARLEEGPVFQIERLARRTQRLVHAGGASPTAWNSASFPWGPSSSRGSLRPRLTSGGADIVTASGTAIRIT